MAYATPPTVAVGDQIAAAHVNTLGSDVQALGGVRTGARARTNALQAVGAATTATMNNGGTAAWSNIEDSGGFVSGAGGSTAPIIIPAGLGGLYMVGIAVTMSATATTRGFCELIISGTPNVNTRAVFTGDTSAAVSVPLALAAGATVGGQVFNNVASSVATGCDVWVYRIGN
jgi:hypothetical protein